jgi:diaminopimelate epimerase
MDTPFWKMHGAGNDFILIDDRQRRFPEHDTAAIAAICCRRTGIGSEGLILIQDADTADFRMRFFNPDGNEVDMCGNGARCVARLAHDIGVAGSTMTIETRAGRLSATVRNDAVQIYLPPPFECRSQQTLSLPSGETIQYDFLNTGVPHVVVLTESVEHDSIVDVGSAIRHHAAFLPNGTNANFVEIRSDHEIRVRTYERGVEDETLACGTGIAAAAVSAALYHGVQPPVSAMAQSGDCLVVDFRISDGKAEELSLTGPAVYVFSGEIALAANGA